MHHENRDVYFGVVVDLIVDSQLHLSQSDIRRDIRYLARRYDNEGLSFLTIRLPLLAEALHQGLETGTFRCPSDFKVKKGTQLPCFLHRLWKGIFDDNGQLLDDPLYIAEVRQISLILNKMKVNCSDERTSAALDEYMVTDLYESVPSALYRDAANALSFIQFDPKEIDPRHGPGAVSQGEKYERKFDFDIRYGAIHEVYPYYDYFRPIRRHGILGASSYFAMRRAPYGISKVVVVPKTSKAPRIICAEPKEYQWVQQGLSRKLMSFIESHTHTKGFVNFTDQGVNRRLAMESSKTRSMATIDMKEASDRVLVQHVEFLFSKTSILKYLLALRTPVAVLPDGRVKLQNKYASMGNALCFPVEALCFWAVAVSAIRAISPNAQPCVYVYGDDIIVPTRYVKAVYSAFADFGWVVNQKKSFSQGFFRESCGGDYYAGRDVTPARIRVPLIGNRDLPSRFVSLVETSNQLFMKGFWRASNRLLTVARSLKPTVDLPLVGPTASVVGLTHHKRIRVTGKLIYDKFGNECFKGIRKRTSSRILPNTQEAEALEYERSLSQWDKTDDYKGREYVVKNSLKLKTSYNPLYCFV